MDRLSPPELHCGGQKIPITCSGGWLDYQPGELPAELLKRANRAALLVKESKKGPPVHFTGTPMVAGGDLN